MRLSFLSRRGLLAGALAVVVTGCLSPTLPLPPPARPEVSVPDAAGQVSVAGVVPSYTTAVVQNRRTGYLVGQDTGEAGTYVLTLPGQSGDRLDVWYVDGADKSPPVTVLVPEGFGAGGAGGTSGE